MSRPNPYIVAWRRRQANAPRAGISSFALPLVALAAAGPLVQPIFLPFLAEPTLLARGVAGLGLRLGIALCGAMTIFTYSALVRGEERPILDPHPADTGALLSYLLRRVAVERAIWPIGAALLILPMALHGEVAGWALASLLAAGGWLVGLLCGFPVHLGSVWAAESPAFEGVLNLLRGYTPRAQAALIYGPGVALALGIGAIWIASLGVPLALAGAPLGWLALGVPAAFGAAVWRLGRPLARYHYRATVLLAEVDGAYAAHEDPEEARRVYLEWAVRFTPVALRELLLRELRHGWRGLRTFITGAWGLGVIAALPIWAEEGAGVPRAVMLAGAATLIVGAVAPRLAAEDPLWLEESLPIVPLRVVAARLLAVFGWLQGVLVPVGLAIAVRAGSGALPGALGALELFALACAGLGAALSPLRGRALPVYLLLGLLLWAGLALSQPAPPGPLS